MKKFIFWISLISSIVLVLTLLLTPECGKTSEGEIFSNITNSLNSGLCTVHKIVQKISICGLFAGAIAYVIYYQITLKDQYFD